MQYRTSFVTDILGTVGVGLAEFAEVWVIFHNVDVARRARLHGRPARLRAVQPRLLARRHVRRHLDDLPRYIRAGQVDAFYVRPLPLLTQLMTSDLSLRRSVASRWLSWHCGGPDDRRDRVVAGHRACSSCSPSSAARRSSRPLHRRRGPAVLPRRRSEFTNAFTYGGQYAAQQSQQVFPDPLRIFWTFVIPTAFVAYLPAVAILDLPGDHLAPHWLAWFTPLAAALAWTLAGLCWRAGTRHYQGAGG